VLTRVAVVVAILGATTGVVVGCGPSEPFAPVAVGLSGGRAEIHYTACKPAKVKSAKVIKLQSGQKVINGTEPVVWQVSFAQPVALDLVTVGGDVPGGGVVDVSFAGSFEPSTRYEAFLALDNETTPHTGFVVDKLRDGKISYEDKYVSAEDFAKMSACP
jgi:hypothetical protein